MVLNDEELKVLVIAIKNGDEIAFEKFYDIHSRNLYSRILRIIKDEEIVQEILQDVFLKIWTKRDTLDPEKPIKAYLFKIAENLVYKHFRKIAQDQRLIEQLIENNIDYVLPVEDKIIESETKILINKAIESLPPQRKIVFTLCRLEEKSYKEVSELLGISVYTINDHLVKANKSIKQYFLANQHLALLVIIPKIFNHLK
ncbi:RNA polymerase sigma factor [Mucilaginibacter sp. P25]|uniref:RNA polymerase sigma factor n=1 Tax=Mucilaginibacter gossypiicola TaxID=551995 RepID=A0A1H8AVY4_9SPHI|nr:MULTISPECIES: RNA polymerase sigma-70 factor [Mucilaginibacter]UOE52238.1 RNA polymerase sigma-70 factor [Mucilaginibacter sp. SMC90]SEM74636.1 RNA polymerase sigma-70 factor, ECF subfamily [Mucilaginibacter gossypiicola]